MHLLDSCLGVNLLIPVRVVVADSDPLHFYVNVQFSPGAALDPFIFAEDNHLLPVRGLDVPGLLPSPAWLMIAHRVPAPLVCGAACLPLPGCLPVEWLSLCVCLIQSRRCRVRCQ